MDDNQNSELRAAHQLLHHHDIDEDSEVAQPRSALLCFLCLEWIGNASVLF